MATALPQSTGFLSLLQGVLGTDTSSDTVTTQDLNTAKTGTSTQTTTADTTALKTVLDKQLGGITSDQIKAIYQEGAKSVPNLVNTYADAMGNRSVGNTALGNSVSDLNSSILAKIAELNTSLTNNAGTTAANIGNLTKATTSTENSNVAQTGGTTTSVDQSVQIDNQALLKALVGAGIVSGGSSLLDSLGGGSSVGDLLGKAGGAVGIGDGTNALSQIGAALGISGTGAAAAGSTAAVATPVATSALPVATTLPALGTAGASAAGSTASAAAAGQTLASVAGPVEAAALTSGAEAAVASGSTPAFLAANPVLGPIALAAVGFYVADKYGEQISNAASKGVDAVGSVLDTGANAIGNLLGSLFGGGSSLSGDPVVDKALYAGNPAGLTGRQLEVYNILYQAQSGYDPYITGQFS